MKIPLVDLKRQYLNLKTEIDHAITEVINETAFISGKYAKLFEKEFSETYGVKHCISTGNGTDSLYIIMKSLGIQEGDEVITVSNSWISSSETISQTGATPVFVDIETDTFSINCSLIEKEINARTKALLIVHLHGQMCDMNKINALAKKYNLFVIEDCAQSHFSEYNNIYAGLHGIAGSFSFYPGKNLGAYGDAGCIITNNDDLAVKCRKFANHGGLVKHQHDIEGINSRMDGIQANILRVKLNYIKQWTIQRINVAGEYSRLLSDLKSVVKTPVIRKNTKHSFHVYQIECEKRDELSEYLNNKGIQTTRHYPTPLPFLPCYKYLKYEENNLPNVVNASRKILSLPIFPEMTTEEINFVVENIYNFYEKDWNN